MPKKSKANETVTIQITMPTKHLREVAAQLGKDMLFLKVENDWLISVDDMCAQHFMRDVPNGKKLITQYKENDYDLLQEEFHNRFQKGIRKLHKDESFVDDVLETLKDVIAANYFVSGMHDPFDETLLQSYSDWEYHAKARYAAINEVLTRYIRKVSDEAWEKIPKKLKKVRPL